MDKFPTGCTAVQNKKVILDNLAIFCFSWVGSEKHLAMGQAQGTILT
jgi:hypothetical protein